MFLLLLIWTRAMQSLASWPRILLAGLAPPVGLKTADFLPPKSWSCADFS